MSDFHNLNLHFASPADLRIWLATSPRPEWRPTSSTYHNTYKPNEQTWAGHASMRSMQKTYEGYGWDRGPHVYLAVGTNHDGIWLMTPPWLEGIHAGACNSKRYGIECVGDFHGAPMTPPLLSLLAETTAALHDYAGITTADINAHRDCMMGRTCPGDAGYSQKPLIQSMLQNAMQSPPVLRYTEDSPILATFPQPEQVRTWIPGALDMAAEIGDRYQDVCARGGIDVALAIAQMLHETGDRTSWWSQYPRSNPAGIGVNGRTFPATNPRPSPPDLWHLDSSAGLWRMGNAFTSWHHSIAAQVGRLLAYALTDDEANTDQAALIQDALSVRALPPAARGSVSAVRMLGRAHNDSGYGWSDPGTVYGLKLAFIANRLRGWL